MCNNGPSPGKPIVLEDYLKNQMSEERMREGERERERLSPEVFDFEALRYY